MGRSRSSGYKIKAKTNGILIVEWYVDTVRRRQSLETYGRHCQVKCTSS